MSPGTMRLRLESLREYAHARIETCRTQEEKFARAWEHRDKHQHGPPQALVEAWTERSTLQAVLAVLFGEERTTHPLPRETK